VAKAFNHNQHCASAKNTIKDILMSSPLPSLEEVQETFDLLDDWEERYGFIIDLGRSLPALNDQDRSAENKVQGCMSQVWLVHTTDGDTHIFNGDSDSTIVKGLVAILVIIFSGKTKAEMAAIDLDRIFTQMGLEQHISPNRRNGFYAMIDRIQKISA
jgi:cysteine desulfuration protein SufE